MFDMGKAIVLGIVEGITEFLPVSSTGHLIIVNQWLSFSETFTRMFDVVIQLGAILAVVVYFWDRLWPFGADDKGAVFDIWKKTFVAVLPALVLGKLFGDIIEERLFNPSTVALMLVVGGIALIAIERKKRAGTVGSIADMSYRSALMIGFFQCLAMIPGTSRSAATIIGAMVLGTTRTLAAEFSFFLAIPTMIAASGYTLLKHGALMNAHEAGILAVGFVTAFLVAWAVIAVFMRYITKNDFAIFGYYRIALGIIVLLLLV